MTETHDLSVLRDEIAGAIGRLDALEQLAAGLGTRASSADARMVEQDGRQAGTEERTEELARGTSALQSLLHGEVARADRLDDAVQGLVRRLDGVESQLLSIAGRADGNAAAVEDLAKRLSALEESSSSREVRLGLLETRDDDE